MQTILHEFLNAGLLQIGEEDEKLRLLEGASEEIAKKIKSTPLLVNRFTLVGLDARVPSTDPSYELVEKEIFEKWRTITNKIGSSPVQVYRSVMLGALEIAQADDPHLSLAASLVASGRPMESMSGKQAEVIGSMLKRFEANAAKKLEEEWINPIDFTFPKISAKGKKPLLNKEELIAGLSKAVGPLDKAGKTQPNANPHWPNAGQPWSQEFPARAADAVAAVFQGAAKGYLDELQETVRESLEGLAQSIEQLAIRDAKAELLWIRASLYSPSARRGYRGMSPMELLLHSILDISRTVNPASPPSVGFYLKEIVRALHDEKVRLIDALHAIGPNFSNLPEAKWVLSDPLGSKGRRGLISYAISPNPSETFEMQTGFEANFEESLSDLAFRLHRELQIQKLLNGGK